MDYPGGGRGTGEGVATPKDVVEGQGGAVGDTHSFQNPQYSEAFQNQNPYIVDPKTCDILSRAPQPFQLPKQMTENCHVIVQVVSSIFSIGFFFMTTETRCLV